MNPGRGSPISSSEPTFFGLVGTNRVVNSLRRNTPEFHVSRPGKLFLSQHPIKYQNGVSRGVRYFVIGIQPDRVVL